MFFLDEKVGDPLLTYMGLIGCSHTGWPVSLDQVYLVWLPAWASEPGSTHAQEAGQSLARPERSEQPFSASLARTMHCFGLLMI